MTRWIAFLSVVTFFCGCGVQSTSTTPATPPQAAPPKRERPVILATTTSTQDSGLLDVLVPAFSAKTGWKVQTVAVGTGEALAMGKRGDADVLLVHAPKSEEQAVTEGYAIDRRAVMHNDFVLLGPPADPAGAKAGPDTAAALRKIAEAHAGFISRGDDSGTHKKEQSLWKGISVTPNWEGYVSVGQGMGETLRIASEKQAYTLSDRATFLATQNLQLVIVLQGDKGLLNPYHVMSVNPAVHAKVNAEGAKDFADYLVSEEGQRVIREFRKAGIAEPLFFTDAAPAGN